MPCQPARAFAQKLFHFVAAHPVMLVGIKHGNQNIDMREQILKTNCRVETHRVVWPFPPLGKLFIERMMFGGDSVSKRLEQAPEKRLSAAARYSGDDGFEIQWLASEVRPFLAAAA